MMFTPTKWTHHFGVFAGLAGRLRAGRGGRHRHGDEVAAQPGGLRRRRAVRDGAVVRQRQRLVVRLQLGVPWSNQFPEWRFGFTTFLLGLSVAALLAAAWFHFSGRDKSPPTRRTWQRIIQSRWPLRPGCWWPSR